ncbi:MAG: glycosyltransferase family 4 protein [Candidatus Micrarchaeia archaeon]
MDAAISSGGPWHGLQLCREFEKIPVDYRLYTVFVDAKKSGLLPSHVSNHHYFLADFVLNRTRFLRNVRDSAGWFAHKHDLFDRLVASEIVRDNPRLLHAWAGFGLRTFDKVSRRRKIPLVIESGTTHLRFQEELLAAEYENLKMRFHAQPAFFLKKVGREYRLASKIVVPSQFVVDSFVAQGVAREKLALIPYGTDFPRSVPKKQDDVFRVLFAGGQQPVRKGLCYLLEAFSKAKIPNSELIVLGRGVSEDISQFVPKNARNIKFIDKVPCAELNRLYSQSSVFCLPSIEEGSARVIYDAMAHGTPVLVTPNAGAVARNGKDGFVVPIRNPKALCQKLTFLSENETTRRRMGQNARLFVKKYSWSRYAKQVAEVYDELL